MQCAIQRLTSWTLVYTEALATMGCSSKDKEPTSRWKARILQARHSPIRAMMYRIQLTGIKYWVSVHLCRHTQGVTHYVKSQRDDRNPECNESRDNFPQSALVNHEMVLNAESIINIARKRLCMKASPETRKVWEAVVQELKNIGEVELAAFCKPECWWCGNQCPEIKPCGICPPKEMPEIG